MNEALRVEDLSISFHTYDGIANVIEGISLRLDSQETVGLVGESGCGKTVTSKAIMGLLPRQAQVTNGKILFKGRDLLQLSYKELYELRGREMAWIPQDPMSSLNPVFTIEDQMFAVIRWRGTYKVSPFEYLRASFSNQEREEMRRVALEMLRKVRISDPERVLKSYPVQLSGGMRQRILIAMALITKPSLVVADEPGTGLDVSTQNEILELMKAKVEEEKLSVIFISHDLAVAKRICDRVYVMYAGTVAEEMTSERLTSPKHPYTLGLMDSVPRLTGGVGKSIPGMIPDYYKPPQGCRFHPRCPYAMEVCRGEKPPLVKVEPDHLVACYLYKGTQ